MTQISNLVSEIASSAQEQATGLSQVNTAVNQMDQTTQQNAAMVEQSTAASHSLAQEADELSRLMGRFEIGERRPVANDQSRTVARDTRPSVRGHSAIRMKTVGSNALRQPEQDGWKEF